ncbi:MULTISPECIES: universal stress protein [unclassified Motilimonas]|uniref:universal stress protein n=1 Tax=Motilimonas TaxID=1914248 RepID=UPI001E5D278E|nr:MULTISPECIES: universal stress protein [unclassified Motilimonas]MCE0558333.1 universal stress protein [Motilimonas sp. E26]MDO6525315.1 universal stress protein [Motilimonas sp. 1_MG-2023]
MAAYQHILVALSLDKDSRTLLNKAVERARIEHAKLTLLHVNMQLNQLYTDMIAMDIEEIKKQLTEQSIAELDTLMAELDYPLIEHRIVCGEMPESILTSAKSLEVDLIIAGHHHGLWSYFHTTAKKLLHQAPCDLLIVPITNH